MVEFAFRTLYSFRRVNSAWVKFSFHQDQYCDYSHADNDSDHCGVLACATLVLCPIFSMSCSWASGRLCFVIKWVHINENFTVVKKMWTCTLLQCSPSDSDSCWWFWSNSLSCTIFGQKIILRLLDVLILGVMFIFASFIFTEGTIRITVMWLYLVGYHTKMFGVFFTCGELNVSTVFHHNSVLSHTLLLSITIWINCAALLSMTFLLSPDLFNQHSQDPIHWNKVLVLVKCI